MSRRPRVAPELRDLVRQRAKGLCEYCHAAERWQYVEFTIDHILPIAIGGPTTPENLALVCFSCNRRKWDRCIGVDPETAQESRLFNPRIDIWNEHFTWLTNGIEIRGMTTIGRTTVAALELNRERILLLRAADAHVGRHPPEDDARLL
jgi:hypothetical protein